MTVKRAYILIAILVIASLLMTSCADAWDQKYQPHNFPESRWICEEIGVEFTTGEKDSDPSRAGALCTGTITLDGEEKEVVLQFRFNDECRIIDAQKYYECFDDEGNRIDDEYKYVLFMGMSKSDRKGFEIRYFTDDEYNRHEDFFYDYGCDPLYPHIFGEESDTYYFKRVD